MRLMKWEAALQVVLCQSYTQNWIQVSEIIADKNLLNVKSRICLIHMHQTDQDLLDDNGTNQKLILVKQIAYTGPKHGL